MSWTWLMMQSICRPTCCVPMDIVIRSAYLNFFNSFSVDEVVFR